MSSIWLLEAKPYPGDTRSSAATSARFYLTPGKWTVGRLVGQCEIDVVEDKSISRTHATITVPTLEEWASEPESQPYVVISDTSRYGTLVTKENNLGGNGSTNTEARAYDMYFIRFGYSSPFRLVNQAISLRIHPLLPSSVKEMAVSLGFALTDDCSQEGTRLIVTKPEKQATSFPADGSVLHALLHKRPILKASWLEEWHSNKGKIWKNNLPLESNHEATITYINKQNQKKVLSSSQALLAAAEDQIFKGHTLLWTPAAREATTLKADTNNKASDGGGDINDLQLAAEEVGSSNQDVPTSPAKAARVPKQAVVVLKDESSVLPSHLRKHPYTTIHLLIASLLEGSLKGMILRPTGALEDSTPSKKRKATAGGTKALTKKQKLQSHQAATGTNDEHDEDETTDEEIQHLAPPPALAIITEDDVSNKNNNMKQGGSSHEAKGKSKALAPASQAEKRKAKEVDGEEEGDTEEKEIQTRQEQAELVGKLRKTATAKRQKKTTTAAAVAVEVRPQPVLLSPQEGWKMTQLAGARYQHNQQQQQQQHDKEPMAQSPPPPPPAAAAEEEEDEDAINTERERDLEAAHPPNRSVDDSKNSLVSFANLIMLRPAPSYSLDAASGSYRGPNFKAFKRKPALQRPRAAVNSPDDSNKKTRGRRRSSSSGYQPPISDKNKDIIGTSGMASTVSTASGDVSHVIPYHAEPYREQSVIGADEFMRAERERLVHREAAEALFHAQLKAKKAPPLPAGSEDSPPAATTTAAAGRGGRGGGAARGRGRGRGRGKA